MTGGGFEDKPATKGDLAEVKGELVERVEEAKVEVLEEVRSGEKKLGEKIDKGFHHLREIFGGAGGLLERLEKVEERVGLR